MNNKKGILLIVSGPSGAGKGTIVNGLLERGTAAGLKLCLSVSMTSRPQKTGETDGVSYCFVTKERFEQAIAAGELLEYNCYNGRYYGTPRQMVEERIASGEDVILEIDVNGGDQVVSRFQSAVRVFVMPPSMEVLEQRLRGRGRDSEEDIAHRLAEAQREIDRAKDYDHVIINDDLDTAVAELIDVINQEKAAQ